MCTNLWNHFVHSHMRDTIVILEEGNHPYSLFLTCNMFVMWAEMNKHHPTTTLCIWRAEMKR